MVGKHLHLVMLKETVDPGPYCSFQFRGNWDPLPHPVAKQLLPSLGGYQPLLSKV